ncbi:Alanine racemase [Liberibacter crescens BT-1]|uniref:Alanine racemase n=1 Tax=Liberibacter crescens (strain BT-1) TaxID=1215343 RepID=L0ES33_LIBCB|nr:alanine racemase [Liberibacter crescens]AGA64309.1 Alanine racemase [Liberibacter crescens BT-1]AMC12522.1 alanine racemase [Liberibacter crescens]
MIDSISYTNQLLRFKEADLRLKVDLVALADNWRSLIQKSGTARTSAVIKANAYGLGVESIARTLYKIGAKDFFVATVDEGKKLRPYVPQAQIFVLNGIWPGEETSLFNSKLIPVISSQEQLDFYMSMLTHYGPYCCALQIDTGLNRLGLSLKEATALSQKLSDEKKSTLLLIMSHLACGNDPSSPMNIAQLEAFRTVISAYPGIEASLSASGGIFLGKEYHFQLTRPGIAIYGGNSIKNHYNMKPVVTAEARILMIREAKIGETVSYGGKKKLTRDSRIAIASIGYADGYPLSLSSADIHPNTKILGGNGFINGHMLPILGQVTMDMTMFDVTNIPEIKIGDYIQVFGSDLKIDEVAHTAGTTSYEMLLRLGNRYKRLYSLE